MPNTVAEKLQINPHSIAADHVHVVAAIVWQTARRERFLIAQRPADKHLGGLWEFPGGKVESGELVEQALTRELLEEIDIEVIVADSFMRIFCPYPDRNVLLDTWIVTDYRGEPKPREGQKLAWIGFDEIDEYAFPPADIPILDALKRTARE